MDLDSLYFSSLLKTKKAQYLKGMAPRYFEGEWVKVFKFVRTFFSQFGHLPTLTTVKQKFKDRPFFKATEPALFYAGEMRERHSFLVLDEAMQEGYTPARAKGDLVASVDAIKEAIQKVQRTEKDKSGGLLRINKGMDWRRKEYLLRMKKKGLLGIPTPWPSLDKVTQGWQGGDLPIFLARPGVGKCVAKGTEIPSSENGIYFPIEDLCTYQFPVWTKQSKRQISAQLPSHYWRTGVKECLEITTVSGLSLVVTPEHPLATVDGWIPTDELKEGDYIETVKWMPEPTNLVVGKKVEHIDLTAALLAEGSCTTDPPKVSNMDKEILERVRAATNFLGAEMKKHKGMGECTWALTGGQRGGAPNPVREFMKEHQLGYEKAIKKEIPDWIFSLPNKLLGRFLGMFWSCDGTVMLDPPTLSMGLGSKKMLYQVKRLLLRFGITGRIRYKEVHQGDKHFDSWELRVHSTCYSEFKKSILLVGEKVAKLRMLSGISINPNVDNIPITIGLTKRIRRIYQEGKERGKCLSKVGKMLGQTCLDIHKFTRRETVSKRLLRAFAEEFEAQDLLNLCRPHWDKITSIKPVGKREVYDLTVPDTHCFVANDILAHNSFSAILCMLACQFSGANGLLASMEMMPKRLGLRYDALGAEISPENFRKGKLKKSEKKKLDAWYKRLAEDVSLGQVDIAGPAEISSPLDLELAINLGQYDFVVWDSFYLASRKKKWEEFAQLVADLKNLATRCGIPILLTSQFNKDVKIKHSYADISAAAFTDSIVQDADFVFAWFQTPAMKLMREMLLRSLKIREGVDLSELTLRWDIDKGDFSEISATLLSDSIGDPSVDNEAELTYDYAA